MKQNIIMIIVLIALFFFGLLIYDFSDELSKDVTSHDWYLYQDNSLTVMSFKKNKFAYYEVDSGNAIEDYDLCSTFRYNKSINVVKLNCNVTGNKIYLASVNKDELTLTIEGTEKTFYATENKAEIAKFKVDNNLSDKEYDQLMKLDLTKYTYYSIDEIIALYKNKNDVKDVAFVNSKLTYKNILNYKALDNIINSNPGSIVLVTTDDFSTYEVNKLHDIYDDFSVTPKSYIKNSISIYEIGNKKVKLIKTLDVSSLKEAESINSIN